MPPPTISSTDPADERNKTTMSIPRLRSGSMALRAVRLIAERQRALLVVVTTSGRVRAKGAQERPGRESLGGIDRASRLNPAGAHRAALTPYARLSLCTARLRFADGR